jgi:E3 ubiquitin-protein ligase RNF115/126
MRRPADSEAVKNLPVIPVERRHCKRNEEGELEMPTCSVCLTEFELGVEAIFVPCGHIFHTKCLHPWLKDHNTCPVCRY